ncbi:MAG: hypothetical protein SLAVMIC_00155 [uncultured marine phage]|uniref:Uncharacterized protein n=1 Tax=uncultured marine phage TaxID=707152 RepID=A0A8D9C8F3_9VIRU|nr:MAG: hypothetical protein SLAVMIC_00155 [uncultured marine phage]
MIKKYNEFVNEAASSKKEEAKAALLKMFNSNPKVKAQDKSKGWVDRKNIYDMAAISSFMKDKGFNSNQADSALQDLRKDKEVEIKHILVKNWHYKENNPHYYLASKVTKEDAKSQKEKMEAESKENTKKDSK